MIVDLRHARRIDSRIRIDDRSAAIIATYQVSSHFFASIFRLEDFSNCRSAIFRGKMDLRMVFYERYCRFLIKRVTL